MKSRRACATSRNSDQAEPVLPSETPPTIMEPFGPPFPPTTFNAGVGPRLGLTGMWPAAIPYIGGKVRTRLQRSRNGPPEGSGLELWLSKGGRAWSPRSFNSSSRNP